MAFTSRVTTRDVAGLLVATAGEALLVLLALRGLSDVYLLVGLHGAIVLACAAVLYVWRAPGGDHAIPAISLMLIAIAGPAGVLPLLASLPFARMRTGDQAAVDAWYERLARAGKPSAITQTYDRIASGRVHRLDTAPPADFLEVIRSGGMEERQRALGLIARHFHPDYAPVLQAALRSPEPVVRVQAAAVVARVREDLKVRVAALAREQDRSPEQALTDAGELSALQACPMVSDSQQAVCREAAQRLMRQVLTSAHDLTRSLPPAGRDTLVAVEDFFIAEQRFKDLRVLRRLSNTVGSSLRSVRRRRAGLERAA